MSTTRFAPAIYRAPLRRQQTIAVGGLTPASDFAIPALPGSYAVTGFDADIAGNQRSLNCAPGSFSITGTAAVIPAARLFTASPGSYTYTLFDTGLMRGTLFFSIDPGSYAITGADANFGQTIPDPVPTIYRAVKSHTPKQREKVSIAIGALQTSSSISLDCQPGLYNVTYFDADIAGAGRTLDSQPGSYAITGVDATLEFSGIAAAPNEVMRAIKAHTPKKRRLTSQSIAALAPVAATGLSLDAQPGSFAITGLDAVLPYDVPGATTAVILRAIKAQTPKPRRKLSIAFNQFTPVPELALSADPGSFAVTVPDANTSYEVPTTWDRIVSPTYAHNPWQIVYGSRQFYGVEIAGFRELSSDSRAFAITGSAATFVRTYNFNAAPGSFTLPSPNSPSSPDAQLVYDSARHIAPPTLPGSFTITGTDIGTGAALLFTASPGSFTFSGADVTMPRGKELTGLPGSYAVTGVTASLFRGNILFTAGSGSYVLTGRTARLVPNDITFTDHTPTVLTLTDI